MSKTLYRYEIRYTNYDDGETDIWLRKFDVVRETDKSYLIRPYGYDKWIRKNSPGGYAHPDKKDAKQHFIRRTHKRVSWYEFWLRECKKGLELIQDADQ